MPFHRRRARRFVDLNIGTQTAIQPLNSLQARASPSLLSLRREACFRKSPLRGATLLTACSILLRTQLRNVLYRGRMLRRFPDQFAKQDVSPKFSGLVCLSKR